MENIVLRKHFYIGVAVIFLMVNAPVIFAEEEPPTEFTYGAVTSISGDQISLSEYDYEKDEEFKADYTIDPSIELQNILSLDQLSTGDEVEIYYDNKDGKKIAKIISRPQVEDEQNDNDRDAPVGNDDMISSNQTENSMNVQVNNAQLNAEQKGE